MASDETLVTYPLPGKVEESEDADAEEPSFYPPYKWGLAYMARTNSKLFVKDILDIKPMPMFPMAYEFNGHPIYNVEVVGNVFLIDSRRQMDIYGVDDGTGCLKCVVWRRETNLTDPRIVEEIGATLSTARLGSLICFTGRIKTYKDKNELAVQGCHVLQSWKELIMFRSLAVDAYEAVYSRRCHLPHRVDQALSDYFYEKSAGKKSRRWFETQVERNVLESLDGEKTGQRFSHDFLEDETIVDLLRRGWRSVDESDDGDYRGDHRGDHRGDGVRKILFDILNKMESKGSIYYLPFGSHKAHLCVLVDRRCRLTKQTLAKLKQLAKGVGDGGGGFGSGGELRDAGFSVKQILSHVRSANEEFCLVQKVAVERCLEILESESEVYGVGRFRYMPV